MVCFVDDDPVYWGVAANFLVRKGIKTGRCVSHDISRIKKMIEDCSPDVIVVCFKITQLTTLDSVKWINNHYPNIKVIIATQFSSLLTLKRCGPAKFVGYFFKSADDISKMLELINLANAIGQG